MKIGNISLEKPILLAPMEDVTDSSFRTICKRLEADILYTEFTSSEALIRDVKKALKKIEFSEEERPIGIQLFGGIETSMEEATKVAERYKPDLIDINCGCWVKNHTRRGEGAALLKDLPKFEKIVKSTVKATNLPVTVKTRLGWCDDSIVILDAARMVEDAGAKALTVHCRTRTQGHKGQADWTWLEKLKKTISIPVIGNGDVTTPEDVKKMFETGCDGVMIGRGAISNPWIFKQAKHYLATGALMPEATLQEKIAMCIDHLKLAVEQKGQWYGIMSLRKHYSGYLKGIPNIAQLRADLMQLMEIDKIIERLHQFHEQNVNFVRLSPSETQ